MELRAKYGFSVDTRASQGTKIYFVICNQLSDLFMGHFVFLVGKRKYLT